MNLPTAIPSEKPKPPARSGTPKLLFAQFGIISILLLYIPTADAQSPANQDELPTQDVVNNFRPSLAVVIGVLSLMFFLTFVLILYAKFCHHPSSPTHRPFAAVQPTASTRFSGVDKSLIESIPFFRFSSLRGSREGLECAVCLSKFEDIEILRLLPKCRHAFHIDCVDRWLEKHSSCPLCRQKVDSSDLEILKYSNSLRFLWSKRNSASELELFVEREEDHHHGSSRFSIGGSLRKLENNEYKNVLALQKNRWSSVSCSDLTFLNSEMINDESSRRFSNLGRSRNSDLSNSKVSIGNEKRSMSEIIIHPRFRQKNSGERSVGENSEKEERRRLLWEPIAERTAQWLANREERSMEIHNTRESLNV